MIIKKCDICKKQIKNQMLDLAFEDPGRYKHWSFCFNCADSILVFLNKKKLIEKSNKKS
jgi:hypothetical protein